MCVLFENDCVGKVIAIEGKEFYSREIGLHAEPVFAVEMAIMISAREEQPVEDLFLQGKRIGRLEMIVAFLNAEGAVLSETAQIQKARGFAASVVVVKFRAESALESDAGDFVVEIELQNVQLLV